MCRIQQEFFNSEFREIGLHRKEGMQERKHIVAGSALKERENGEITVGIGGHIHVEVVAEEITFPMGIPTPVAIRL